MHDVQGTSPAHEDYTAPGTSRLFAPIQLGRHRIKNRLVFSPHATGFVQEGCISEDHIAYYESRAAGGVGLIVAEQHAVHPSAVLPKWLSATSNTCIPALSCLAETVHRHDCKLVAQIFYAGRITQFRNEGMKAVFYAVSDVPDERFRQVPRTMPKARIEEVIPAFGDAAFRMKLAGLDGVEFQAAFAYLPAQFLNPRTNTRTDEYGGSFDNRLRFVRRVLADIREKIGDDMVIGMRVSGDEMDYDGLTPEETLEVCAALEQDGIVDYFNLGSGSDTSVAGWAAAVPPAPFPPGLLASVGGRLKQRLATPIIVAGRINQPQIAEQILARGEADLIGMARGLISDPEFPNKARQGRFDDIRACVGCNQACIGHREAGFKVSCIQYPESGRERRFLQKPRAASPKTLMIAGGGPAGMKAAVVAAQRGHRVTLCEASGQLGGQVRLAQLLPGRAEFGGVITNLERELALAQVIVRRNTLVTLELVREERPDTVIVATGSLPRAPAIEIMDEAHIVGSWEVISGEAKVGASVVIADWRCDWVGMGVAEKLAREGCRVRLAVTGMAPGELIQSMVRERWMGDLHRAGVEIIPYLRLFGADGRTVYFRHTASGEAVVLEDVDTLVLAFAQQSQTSLADALEASRIPSTSIGDCLNPRTVEEAVFEGMVAGLEL